MKYIFLFILGCCSLWATSQNLNQQTDSLIFNKYIAFFTPKKYNQIDKQIVNTAIYFLNCPYKSNTLESAPEHLVINLRQFDCTTFVENCVALSLTIQSQDHSFQYFKDLVRKLRYRNGVITDYASRLNYFSNWIIENQKRGTIENLSLSLGGKTVNKTINFISQHPDNYKSITSSKILQKIRNTETEISHSKNYVVIDKKNIRLAEPQIHDGDIIAFATRIKGLDYTHVGIAYHNKENKLLFINASSIENKVVISKKTIDSYCLGRKSCTGISVIRLK